MGESSSSRWTRESAFGVKMSKDGETAKIINADKFHSWSFWVGITPRMASTVFSRLSYHISVLCYLVFGNLVFFMKRSHFSTSVDWNESSKVEVRSLIQRLLTFTLAGYMLLIVRVYYFDVRSKIGRFFGALSKIVTSLLMVIEHDDLCKNMSRQTSSHTQPCHHQPPREQQLQQQQQKAAELLMFKMYTALSTIGKFALYCSASNTNKKLTEEKIEQLFIDAGYDATYVCGNRHRKDTISIMKLAILQSLRQEAAARNNNYHYNVASSSSDGNNSTDTTDAFKSSGSSNCSIYSEFWCDSLKENLVEHIEEYAGCAMSVSSCVSTSKLSYAHNQLMHIAVRLFMAIEIYITYHDDAINQENNDIAMPIYVC